MGARGPGAGGIMSGRGRTELVGREEGLKGDGLVGKGCRDGDGVEGR